MLSEPHQPDRRPETRFIRDAVVAEEDDELKIGKRPAYAHIDRAELVLLEVPLPPNVA